MSAQNLKRIHFPNLTPTMMAAELRAAVAALALTAITPARTGGAIEPPHNPNLSRLQQSSPAPWFLLQP